MPWTPKAWELTMEHYFQTALFWCTVGNVFICKAPPCFSLVFKSHMRLIKQYISKNCAFMSRASLGSGLKTTLLPRIGFAGVSYIYLTVQIVLTTQAAINKTDHKIKFASWPKCFNSRSQISNSPHHRGLDSCRLERYFQCKQQNGVWRMGYSLCCQSQQHNYFSSGKLIETCQTFDLWCYCTTFPDMLWLHPGLSP